MEFEKEVSQNAHDPSVKSSFLSNPELVRTHLMEHADTSEEREAITRMDIEQLQAEFRKQIQDSAGA